MHSRTAAVLAAVRKHGSTKTYEEIAAMLGTTLHRVGSLAARYGIKKPYVASKLHALQRLRGRPSNATILATVKQHAATHTQKQIAAMLGVSTRVVAKTSWKAGFKKPMVQIKHREALARQRAFVLAHAPTHTMAELGQMMGVSKARAGQICRRWGVRRISSGYSKASRMSDRELRDVARQRDKTLTAIAAEVGVHVNTLKHELRQRGIAPFTRREYRASLAKKGMWVCCHCRRVKPLDQFGSGAIGPCGVSARCLKCGRTCAAVYRRRKAEQTLTQGRGKRLKAVVGRR
ncbi:MAG: hypothetical protein HZC54_20575 [Verrucomicrobia bacterium]|nr:hypothetical protein [Verrucomicrobiota bacterium]